MIARFMGSENKTATMWFYKLISYICPSRFRYDGLLDHAPSHFPKAHVVYPDGERSITMAVGNAYEYAELFGGEVIRE